MQLDHHTYLKSIGWSNIYLFTKNNMGAYLKAQSKHNKDTFYATNKT